MSVENAQKLIVKHVTDHIDICSHCGTQAHLEMVFNDYFLEEDEKELCFYVVFRCKPCKKLIVKTCLFRQEYVQRGYEFVFKSWEDRFPKLETLLTKKYEDIVPELILEDYKEGIVCLANDCYRSAVSMFRRALQATLIDKGADKRLDLIVQIKNMEKLTDDLKDWAHNVRIFGNWGAHPQDDHLKDVDEKTAEEAKNFIEEFFNYVYVMPFRVAKARGIETQIETVSE